MKTLIALIGILLLTISAIAADYDAQAEADRFERERRSQELRWEIEERNRLTNIQIERNLREAYKYDKDAKNDPCCGDNDKEKEKCQKSK